jgi:hypothetical protein
MKIAARPVRPGFALLLATSVLAGCGGGSPYVLTDFHNHQLGRVEVCYDHSKTSLAEAQKLADGICDQFERVASYRLDQRNQCNWRTPDIVLFECVARPGETPPPFVPQKAPLRNNATGN